MGLFDSQPTCVWLLVFGFLVFVTSSDDPLNLFRKETIILRPLQKRTGFACICRKKLSTVLRAVLIYFYFFQQFFIRLTRPYIVVDQSAFFVLLCFYDTRKYLTVRLLALAFRGPVFLSFSFLLFLCLSLSLCLSLALSLCSLLFALCPALHLHSRTLRSCGASHGRGARTPFWSLGKVNTEGVDWAGLIFVAVFWGR